MANEIDRRRFLKLAGIGAGSATLSIVPNPLRILSQRDRQSNCTPEIDQPRLEGTIIRLDSTTAGYMYDTGRPVSTYEDLPYETNPVPTPVPLDSLNPVIVRTSDPHYIEGRVDSEHRLSIVENKLQIESVGVSVGEPRIPNFRLVTRISLDDTARLGILSSNVKDREQLIMASQMLSGRTESLEHLLYGGLIVGEEAGSIILPKAMDTVNSAINSPESHNLPADLSQYNPDLLISLFSANFLTLNVAAVLVNPNDIEVSILPHSEF